VTPSSPFEQRRTCATLIEFARGFRRQPYAIYRGVYYQPFFYGPSEIPCYRRSSSLSDRGEIVTAWPDGRSFQSQMERDEACVQDAARQASDDPTRAEALAWIRGLRNEASSRAMRARAARVRAA